MGELVRRLDYERRSKEWLKRRSRLNLQTRECHQTIRSQQKREDRLLLQKLARLEFAIRLMNSDYKRDVCSVETFRKRILTRSIQFDYKLFKEDRSDINASTRSKASRFLLKVTGDEDDVVDTELNSLAYATKTEHAERVSVVDSNNITTNVSETRAPSRSLFVISETEDRIPYLPTPSPNQMVLKTERYGSRPSSGIQQSRRGSDSLSPKRPFRSMSVAAGGSLQRGSKVSVMHRRPSTPLISSSEKSSVSQNKYRTDYSEYNRPASVTSLSPGLSYSPASERGYIEGSDDVVIVGRFKSGARPMSCELESSVDPMATLDRTRPVTADQIMKLHQRSSAESESRSFKYLRDTYKGIYQEDLDEATKRVIHLRSEERLNVKRLQEQVRYLCLKMKKMFSEKDGN